MAMSGHFQAMTAFLQGTFLVPPVPIRQEGWWTRGLIWTLWSRGKSHVPVWNQTTVSQTSSL